MRAIKFRAKTRDGDTADGWVYSSTHGLSDFWHGVDEGRHDEETVGQFTGLLDRHGKEIYEGDITNNGIIEFGDCSEGIGFYLKDNGMTDEPTHTLFAFTTPFEVIGNIYENPNLVK